MLQLKNAPAVSVIIACYNQSVYLSEALESLLCQTCCNWEGIVVNDGSSDNTEEIALNYVSKDCRFRYLSKENGGVSSARNYGISNAIGTFILPLDADDLLAPTYIEKALLVYQEIPQTRLVYSQWSFFGVTTEAYPLCYNKYENLLQGNSIFCSAVFRRSDCLAIGGYDEKMLVGYEDWEFYIRFLDEASIVHQIPEPLFAYRIKEESRNVTANKEENQTFIYNYLYLKNIDKYIACFGCAINVIREMNHYKQEMEKARNKYENEWFRLLFYKLKKAFGSKA